MKPFKILLFCFFTVFFCPTITDAQNLSLKVIGKDSLETQIIDSIGYQKSFINFKLLNTEVDTLNNKLQHIGYIETIIVSIERDTDSSYLAKFSLNKKYDYLYVYYDSELISKSLLNSVSENITPEYFVIFIKDSETTLNYLSSKIIENGLPFASLNLNEIELKDENSLQAKLDIELSSKRTIDKIVIKGYEKFPKSYIKHYLRIKTGSNFDIGDINEKTSNLNALRFANQIKDPEVLFTKDSTSVYLYLEKSKSNTFDGFLGFSTNETTNNLELDGFLDLNLVNNLNFGESLSILYKSDENSQVTFDAKVNLPYLFKSPIGVEVALNIFRRDTIFNTTTQSARVFYQANANQRVYAGVDAFQSTNLLDTSSDINLQDFDAINYNVRYEYTKPQFNNLLFPINFLFDIKGGFGNRDFGEVSENQSIFNLKTFKIFNLNTKNSIYLNFDGGSIISDSFLTNELLRFGGINSIRGFEENSLQADLFGVLNTEYRYQLNQGIFVHSIIDLAYFEDATTDTIEKLFGFGFGFGIITKAGLLRFNYANGRTENQPFRLSDSQIHLSLNARF